MSPTHIIHGYYREQSFIPDSSLPNVEGRAELIITPSNTPERHSMRVAIGRAATPKSAGEIDAMIQSERESWDRE